MKKNYGKRPVLDNISLSHRGGILGVAGSNGSGKSTLLKCLAGLLSPTSGRIVWTRNGNILDPDELKQNLGFVAPYINLYHELSIRENLELILNLRKHRCTEQQINRQLESMQLVAIENQLFGELSTGQQQRARLACTLIYNPALLFLDEPGANLDENGRIAVREIIREYSDRDNLVLLASNNPRELKQADRIFSVEQGWK